MGKDQTEGEGDCVVWVEPELDLNGDVIRERRELTMDIFSAWASAASKEVMVGVKEAVVRVIIDEELCRGGWSTVDTCTRGTLTEWEERWPSTPGRQRQLEVLIFSPFDIGGGSSSPWAVLAVPSGERLNVDSVRARTCVWGVVGLLDRSRVVFRRLLLSNDDDVAVMAGKVGDADRTERSEVYIEGTSDLFRAWRLPGDEGGIVI
jgi:hypothetical protein